ncbi:MAG: thioredoxin family protein [Candidatus Lokiarchaeota archaeon]|nr:thioredoxin family protein [Candidatus Lokiarchaeota archaeon]
MSLINFNEYGIIVPKKGTHVLQIGSKWCKSCKNLSIILRKMAEEQYISYDEIDIGNNSKLAVELGICSVPVLIFFKNGKTFKEDIVMYGEQVVTNGILVGSFNEKILKYIIKQL